MNKKINRHKKRIVVVLMTLSSLTAFTKPLPEAYKALRTYDYFKAKHLFYKLSQKSTKAYADYGLALIFSRNDNPFYNLDSAAKYCHTGYSAFVANPAPLSFSGFNITETSLKVLLDSVAQRNLILAKKMPSVIAYELFLINNYLANATIIREAIYLRDELEFNQLLQINKSDSTIAFIASHPQSSFRSDAVLLRDRQIFDETTSARTAAAYISFIRQYPDNTMIPAAHEQLYAIYKRNSDKAGLKNFVYNYPKALQYTEAWKLLFALSVSSFSDEELIRFLAEYPEFPLKNSILKELQLSQLQLYPYKNDELFGFVDSTGKLRIATQYDAVTPFQEGLAVVNRNDSVFYINKEDQNVFESYYEDAYGFKNGIAAVKKSGKWFFINRQAQSISAPCDEVNELADDMYVFQFNQKYGALDHFGRKIIEPRFEQLGDFKNGFAYFLEGSRYGFISKTGVGFKAQFDWISDFEWNEIAIFRLNNKYGLLNTKGHILLEAKYDQILRLQDHVVLLVIGSNYGFYDVGGCFISPIVYDYQKERAETDYYRAGYFRLIKNKAQSMMDENGATRINFGVYDEIGFASNGLFRVKKKNNYGYVDRKLQNAIPYQYEWAADFEDSLALVKAKGVYKLITLKGQDVLLSLTPIQKLSSNYYITSVNGELQLFNRSGKMLFSGIKYIQSPQAGLILFTLNSGEIKLLKDETFVNLNSKIQP